MKNSIYIVTFLLCVIIGCNATKSAKTTAINPLTAKKDTIRIANDSLKYEVIIIDPGFNTWLNSTALPINYHSQSYLETLLSDKSK